MTATEITSSRVSTCVLTGEPRVLYSGVFPGGWVCGSMRPEVWAVWEAAGFPRNEEDAGLVWVGDIEYGEWGLPS